MFKIFLKILFIYTFFLTNLSANDNLLKKFHKLKIYSLDNNKLIKIGSVRGKVEEYPWGFNYYLNSKNGNLSELIETFYFDNYGDHMSRFNRWARDVVFISNSKNGCNNSEDKVFHGVIDNGATHFNCFSVNNVGSKPIVKEFIQPSYSDQVDAMVELQKIDRDETYRASIEKGYSRIRDTLKPGAAKNVAAIAEKMIS